MRYRPVGRTGLSASIIGLGAEHLDGKPQQIVTDTIHASIDQGINIIDLFMPGEEVRRNIGEALKGRRDKVMIQGHIGSVDLNQQYDISRDLSVIRRYFENLLRFLKTDYIDFGMMFFIDSEEDYKGVFETGFADYVQSLKKEGKIRAIGASSHNPVTAKRVVETGIVDMMMFSINPAFDMTPIDTSVFTTLEESDKQPTLVGIDPTRAAFYSFCEQRGVGLTVMKTLGAGKLLSREQTPFSEPMSVAQCVEYALSRPAVASVLLGMRSPEEVRDAVRYLDMTEEEKDYTRVLAGFKGGFSGSCVYCNHCQPCPSGIDIAAVNKYLDIALVNPESVPPSIRQHYGALSAHGGDCIACGSCEKRCPFSVEIIEKMRKAIDMFGR